ncbi:hypothetical protein M2371_003238 [Buttiauxella sp. BIGb0471]|nr:hypothetical protein [Buttiauxella sp. BIGb0471]
MTVLQLLPPGGVLVMAIAVPLMIQFLMRYTLITHTEVDNV